MLDEQIERELADGEPWCYRQQTKLPPHLPQCVEPEQETPDIYEEALRDYMEQIRKSLYGPEMKRKKGSLYQKISHYLCLLGLRKTEVYKQ